MKLTQPERPQAARVEPDESGGVPLQVTESRAPSRRRRSRNSVELPAAHTIHPSRGFNARFFFGNQDRLSRISVGAVILTTFHASNSGTNPMVILLFLRNFYKATQRLLT